MKPTIIFILTITVLQTTAEGVIKCNFTETPGGPLCFGAVGQRLIFHLGNTPNTEMTLLKDSIYRIWKKGKDRTVDTEYVQTHWNNHSQFLTSGDLNLGTAMKKHSGSYSLEEFTSQGALLKKATRSLQIKAPVQQPVLSQLCLSPGEMKVSCSSEGEDAELSLRLDNQLLINTSEHNLITSSCTDSEPPLVERRAEEDTSNVSRVTVCLNGQLTGNLTCEAWNMVSRHETAVHLKDCEDFISTFPVVTVAVSAGITLLLLVALCLGMKQCNNKPRPTPNNECLPGNNETEIVYSEVTIMRNVKRTTEPDQYSTGMFSPPL